MGFSKMKLLFKIFSVFTFVASSYFSFAQGGWKKKYFPQNSLTNDCGNAIETPSGDIIVMGVTYDTLNGNGYNRLTLIGLDSHGSFLWRKDYGNYKFEYLNTITNNAVITYSNYFLLTVCVRDSNNKYLSSLLKFDFNGDTLWKKKYYSNITGTNLYLNGITKGMDNGLFICGEYADSQSEPAVVIKTDINGNEIWRKIINKVFPNVTRCTGIVEDSTSRRLIVTGFQFIGNATSWDTQSSVLFLDSLGNKIQQKTYNNAGGGGFSSIIQLKDKNLLTGGQWMEQQIGSTTKYRSLLVKFDTNGVIIWSKKYNVISPYNGMGYFIELSNGDILIDGFLDTMQNYLTQPIIKIRLSKIDQNGNLKWQKYIGSSSNNNNSEAAKSMRPTQDGGFIFSSWFPYLQNSKPYSIIKIDSTGCDTLAAYCSSPVGVGEFYNKTGFSVELFPNPANTLVHFKLSAPLNTNFTIKIQSVSGQEIEQFILSPQDDLQLNTTHYSRGIYFVNLFLDGKAIETKKLVIVR